MDVNELRALQEHVWGIRLYAGKRAEQIEKLIENAKENGACIAQIEVLEYERETLLIMKKTANDKHDELVGMEFDRLTGCKEETQCQTTNDTYSEPYFANHVISRFMHRL